MEQKIVYNDEARQALINGVNKLTEVVASTLGPSGHSVVLSIDSIGNPVATKDGVTIAKAINLSDPLENVGAQMVKQASIKTGEEAGDGTTTATVLAHEIISETRANQNGTYNSVQVKAGIDAAVEDAINFIKENVSKPIENITQLMQVATISANGDQTIGRLVSKALDKAGVEGAVTIEESKTGESYLDVVEGIQFDRGYKSPYFVTDNNTMTTVLEDVVVLLVDKKLSTIKELVPVLEMVAQSSKALLIVAEDIESEVLSTLILNKVRAGFKVVAVKAPDFGDKRKAVLEDIAILTGGVVVSPDKGMKLENFQEDWFGTAKKVTVSRDKTTIIDAEGDAEAIQARIEEIKTQIEKAESKYDKEQLQLRLGRFAGGVSVIYVGGHTELELKERKDRVDDALHATKAALEEGVCPGGGKALLLASEHLNLAEDTDRSDFNVGYRAVQAACRAPFRKILDNVGISDVHAEHVLAESSWTSYNPLANKMEDMYEAGIIDPTKVVRLALQNAASVAGTISTSEALVVNIPDKEESNPAY